MCNDTYRPDNPLPTSNPLFPGIKPVSGVVGDDDVHRGGVFESLQGSQCHTPPLLTHGEYEL